MNPTPLVAALQRAGLMWPAQYMRATYIPGRIYWREGLLVNVAKMEPTK